MRPRRMSQRDLPSDRRGDFLGRDLAGCNAEIESPLRVDRHRGWLEVRSGVFEEVAC
jgi:hypothetical protein